MDGVSQANVREHLQSLERLVRAEGDNRAGDLLKKITESSNPLRDLCSALYPKREQRITECNNRITWFCKLSTLSEGEAKTLANITQHWKIEEETITIVSAYARLWKHHPKEFWCGPDPDENIIKRCFNDWKMIQEVIPSREKVLSIITSKEVEQEQIAIRNKGGKRYRQRRATRVNDRDTVHLNLAVKEVCRRTWIHSDKDKERWLLQESREGYKWRKLKRRAIVLSLHQASARSFRRHKLQPVTFEALNAYVETLPQIRIYDLLEEALGSIERHYRSLSNIEWSNFAYRQIGQASLTPPNSTPDPSYDPETSDSQGTIPTETSVADLRRVLGNSTAGHQYQSLTTSTDTALFFPGAQIDTASASMGSVFYPEPQIDVTSASMGSVFYPEPQIDVTSASMGSVFYPEPQIDVTSASMGSVFYPEPQIDVTSASMGSVFYPEPPIDASSISASNVSNVLANPLSTLNMSNNFAFNQQFAAT